MAGCGPTATRHPARGTLPSVSYGHCPRCGVDGEIVREARGRASCAACGGAFVGVEAATANFGEVGLSPQQIKVLAVDKGERRRGCPTCDRFLTTFALKREMFHACLQCRAVWSDSGAWQRIGVSSPRMEPAPFVALPAGATSAPPSHGASPGTSWPATTDDDDAPYQLPSDGSIDAGVGGFRERLSARGAAGLLTVGVGVAIAGLLWFAYGALVQGGAEVPVGGDYAATFWQGETKAAPVTIPLQGGPLSGTRWSSTKGPTRLEVVHAAAPYIGAQTAGAKSWTFATATLVPLYGQYVRVEDGAVKSKNGLTYHDFTFFTEEGKGTHGTGRFYFDGGNVWIATAIGEQKAFAQSGVASQFVASIKRTGG